MSLKTPTDNCLACGHKASTPKRTHKGYELVHCAACGLHWVEPKPTPEELAQYYSVTYNLAVNYAKFDMQHMAQQESRLLHRWIQEFAPDARTVCEVGCATGNLLDEMRTLGYEVSGYELSWLTSEIARQKDLDVTTGTITPGGPKVDVIFLRHVLDHTLHPDSQMEAVAQCLNPGGLVILGVPNANGPSFRLFGEYWFWFIPPAHLWYFTPASLRHFAARNGLSTILEMTQQGDANNLILEFGLAPARWIRKLLKPNGANNGELIPTRPEQTEYRGPARRYLNKITDAIYRPLGWILHPRGLGDELWVIAQKQ